MNQLTAAGRPSKRGKHSQIISGCRKLQATQKPGQSFSVSEIGRACGVHNRAITFIERRAMYNFTKRLHAMAPTVFEEILKDRPIREIFDNLSGDPYTTGKPNRRIKSEKKKVIRIMPMREISAAAAAQVKGMSFRESMRCDMKRRGEAPNFGRGNPNPWHSNKGRHNPGTFEDEFRPFFDSTLAVQNPSRADIAPTAA